MRFDTIKYLNYVYFSDKCDINHIPEKSILFSLIKVYGKAFYFTFCLIKSLFRSRRSFSSHGAVYFFSMSENNYLSLNPVYLKMPQGLANMVGDRKFNNNITLFIP